MEVIDQEINQIYWDLKELTYTSENRLKHYNRYEYVYSFIWKDNINFNYFALKMLCLQ